MNKLTYQALMFLGVLLGVVMMGIGCANVFNLSTTFILGIHGTTPGMLVVVGASLAAAFSCLLAP